MPASGEQVDDAEVILAAAEIVAAGRGHALPDLPDEVRTRLDLAKPSFSDDLANRCRVLVRAIGKESELRDLWDEADELEAWLPTLEDLYARLSRPAVS